MNSVNTTVEPSPLRLKSAETMGNHCFDIYLNELLLFKRRFLEHFICHGTLNITNHHLYDGCSLS